MTKFKDDNFVHALRAELISPVRSVARARERRMSYNPDPTEPEERLVKLIDRTIDELSDGPVDLGIAAALALAPEGGSDIEVEFSEALLRAALRTLITNRLRARGKMEGPPITLIRPQHALLAILRPRDDRGRGVRPHMKKEADEALLGLLHQLIAVETEDEWSENWRTEVYNKAATVVEDARFITEGEA